MGALPSTTYIRVAVLWFLSTGLTGAALFSLGGSASRATFYSALGIACFGQLILCLYAGCASVATQKVARPSAPVFARVLVLFVVWALILLIMAVLAVRSAKDESAQRIILLQAVLTFLLLLAAFFLHRQDRTVGAIQRRQEQRVRLQECVEDILRKANVLQTISKRHPNLQDSLLQLADAAHSIRSEMTFGGLCVHTEIGGAVADTTLRRISEGTRHLNSSISRLQEAPAEELPKHAMDLQEAINNLVEALRNADAATKESQRCRGK